MVRMSVPRCSRWVGKERRVDDAGIKMMATDNTETRVNGNVLCGEEILPAPLLITRARTDGKLSRLKIDVLNPKPDCFHNAQTTPVEQFSHHFEGRRP